MKVIGALSSTIHLSIFLRYIHCICAFNILISVSIIILRIMALCILRNDIIAGARNMKFIRWQR